MTTDSAGATKTEGAVKAGPGRHFFDVSALDGVAAGAGYASTFGPVVEGELTQVGLMRIPSGGEAKAHHHPNEQWIYIIEGEVLTRVADEERRAGPGTLIYIPPDVVHSTIVVSDEDAVFFTTKDLRHGIVGIAVEPD